MLAFPHRARHNAWEVQGWEMRIYPAIDLLNGKCVRLRQGDYSRETVFSDDPVSVARRWIEAGADRIHVVDLDGAKSGKPVNGSIIREIAETVRVPVQLGGGLRNGEDLAAVFDAGIRWAVLGTRALQDPTFVRDSAARYPNRIVLGIDAKDGYVATDGWLKVSRVTATELAVQFADAGIAAIVYTDIATDGMMSGPNYPALAELQKAVCIPIIASGGVSSVEHVQRLLEGGVPGCIIGRALYEGSLDLTTLLNLTRPAAERDGRLL
jgi:phosphoribosylformimino-5-aminoimidazole carboxamide ribotide isomerase